MSYYEFKEEDAYSFSQVYGPATRIGNQLVFTRCPYCEGGRHGDKKTFAIDLKTGQYNCKRGSCGAKGNMITLAKHFPKFQLSENVKRHYNINDYNSVNYRKFMNAHRMFESNDEAIKYLQSRGISEAVCRKYEIKTDSKNKKKLVFPFKDEEGTLWFIKYRNLDPEAKPKEWCEKKCKPILFGMNHCEGFGRLVITEGQIDALSLTEAGVQNAVSVPLGKNGFTWVPHCWNWLVNFQQIVVFGDCENGIVTLAEEITKRFPKITRVVRVEDYKGCKDANEILQKHGKKALVDAVDNAAFVPSKFLKDMSAVESIDIESLPAISTGIMELDEILTGGFHYGDFVVMTGRRGDGKSTMASQLIVEALYRGNNCLIYSGEMKDVAVKNWIDRQISGDRTLINSKLAECEEWYKGRLFIVDDSGAEDDAEDLLETVTDAIIQRNVRFILLDNLMTAMEDTAPTEDALYRQQSNFTGRLAKLARKFDVVIMLICHPRKSVNANLNNDDVSGSADITNKANIVLSYSRVIVNGNEADPRLRDLEVMKNRLTGRQGKVRMFYFDSNKRIVSEKYKDLPKSYLSKKFDEESEEEEIPF